MSPKNYVDVYLAENKTLRSVTFDRDYTEPKIEMSRFGAFNRCPNLEKVVLPNLIANTTYMPVAKKEGIFLPDDTFLNCTNLKELVLPTNIESIGGSCFENCKSLRSLEIPDGVAEINSYAITGCSSMEYLSLPGSLIKITPLQLSNHSTIICPAGSYAEEYVQSKAEEYESCGLDISYSFINSETTDILGDVNGDNELNINDVTLIQKSLVKIYPFDIINYDIYEDNRLSINDATEIQKILANIV